METIKDLCIALRICFFFFQGQRCPGVSFQRIGCYKEKIQKGRPLSDLLFTDRKSSSSKWSGLKYAYQEFNAYLPDLACRCAKATKVKGYAVFGLTNYGNNDSLSLVLAFNTRLLYTNTCTWLVHEGRWGGGISYITFIHGAEGYCFLSHNGLK